MYTLAQYNPLVLGGTLLRSTMLYNASFWDIGAKLSVLFFYCLLFGAGAYGAYYISKDKNFSKLLRKIVRRKKSKKLSVTDFAKAQEKEKNK
jgi:hypothetical protein